MEADLSEWWPEEACGSVRSVRRGEGQIQSGGVPARDDDGAAGRATGATQRLGGDSGVEGEVERAPKAVKQSRIASATIGYIMASLSDFEKLLPTLSAGEKAQILKWVVQ